MFPHLLPVWLICANANNKDDYSQPVFSARSTYSGWPGTDCNAPIPQKRNPPPLKKKPQDRPERSRNCWDWPQMITFLDHPSPPECLDDRLAPLLSLLRGRQAGPLQTARTTSATVPSWWRHASRKNRLQFELLIQTFFLFLFCLFWGCEPLNVTYLFMQSSQGKRRSKTVRKKNPLVLKYQWVEDGRLLFLTAQIFIYSHMFAWILTSQTFCFNLLNPVSCAGVLTLHPHILYI